MSHNLPIYIENKDLLGLLLLLTGTVGAAALLTAFAWLRQVALFLLTAGVVGTTFFDLNIYSAYWYRGTTRGFEFTALDVLALGLLISVALAPRPDRLRWFWPASLGPMMLFLLYCVGTTLVAQPAVFGLFEVSKLMRGAVYFLAIALHVRRERDLMIMVLALVAAVGLETLVALRDRYLLTMYRPRGTLDHPNSLSMYLCLVTPVLVAAATAPWNAWVRRLCWVGVLAAGATMLLTLSRAGLPVFVFTVCASFVLCTSWEVTPLRLAGAALAFVLMTGLVINAWPFLLERYGQSTLQEEYFDAPGESRGYYFRQAGVILENRPLGVGLNNWSYWVSREYGKPLGMHYENYDDLVYAPPSDTAPMYRFAAPAHNLGVLTAAELGWPGLALLLLLWSRWLQVGASFALSRAPGVFRRVGTGVCFGMIGVLLQSFTEWTFRQTQIFLMFHILAGALAALHAVCRAERREAEAEAAAETAWAPAGGGLRVAEN